MKVRELIEKLEKLDGDLEIFASPVVATRVASKEGEKRARKMMPVPFKRYKVMTAIQSGELGADDIYHFCLVFGYDESFNYASENKENDEFIN